MNLADEFLISSAPEWQLQKLRKDELVRLFSLIPHEDEEEAEDGERLTKKELIQAILEAVSYLPLSQSFEVVLITCWFSFSGQMIAQTRRLQRPLHDLLRENVMAALHLHLH
jgi:hypothetical protein